jgi:hypothetical protein
MTRLEPASLDWKSEVSPFGQLPRFYQLRRLYTAYRIREIMNDERMNILMEMFMICFKALSSLSPVKVMETTKNRRMVGK